MPARRKEATQEVGATGLQYTGGKVREEFLVELRGKRGEKTYKEMRHEPIVGACIGTLKRLVKNAPVDVADGSDERASELVRSAFDDLSQTWSDVLDEALTMLPFGWSALEIVYKVRNGENARPGLSSRFADGMLGWRKFAPRSQDSRDRWEFDDEGGVQALHQRTTMPASRAVIPIEKLLLFRLATEKGNPEPPPLTRNCFIPWYFLKHIRRLEGIGIDRGFGGIPKMTAPAKVLSPQAKGNDLATREAMIEIGKNLRNDEQSFIFLPSDRDANGNLLYDISLVTADGFRAHNTDAAIARYTRDIAMALLCDFVLLGHEKVGSFALADSKTSITAMAVAGWLDSILAVFNRHAIPRLLRLNGLSVVDPPRLVRGDIETPDLGTLAAYLTAVANAGLITPTPELEDKLLSIANLPTPSGEGTVGKHRDAEQAAFKALVHEGMRLQRLRDELLAKAT